MRFINLLEIALQLLTTYNNLDCIGCLDFLNFTKNV